MKVVILLILTLALALTPSKSVQNKNQIEYLERRTSQNVVGKKIYSYEFTDDDLSKTPSWDIRKKEAPPISLNQALDGTRKYLQRHFANADQWLVDSIRLELVGKRKWVYQIEYSCPEGVCPESVNFSIVMKMDGEIIEHKITDKE
jgi:hypothetical protein